MKKAVGFILTAFFILKIILYICQIIYKNMKKHIITKINEYLDNQDLSEQELLEMANITDDESGIENVVLWIGPNPKSHGMRIKVSNVPKLQIPHFK